MPRTERAAVIAANAEADEIYTDEIYTFHTASLLLRRMIGFRLIDSLTKFPRLSAVFGPKTSSTNNVLLVTIKNRPPTLRSMLEAHYEFN
jgi:hypothetical protein